MSKAKRKPVVCVIGGGAAGFFGAITLAEQNHGVKVIILEQNKSVLNKVRISGGGRCNVTHACFEPAELVNYYPRGNKELRGPFHKFCTGDTMHWFESKDVPLKIEDDGRVFPLSDKSESIIDCLTTQAKALQIEIKTGLKVNDISRANSSWDVLTIDGSVFKADAVLISPGSSPGIWKLLEQLGHDIIEPIPSLFTFNLQHALIENLQGLSFPNAKIQLKGQKLNTEGPLLITHWGLSGPAILKMSAWGARLFNALQYRFSIKINWTGMEYKQAEYALEKLALQHPKKQLSSITLPSVPIRFWRQLLAYSKIDDSISWSQLDSLTLKRILKMLVHCELPVNGKSTFKEEFVTSGGVALDEVDFRDMQSKKQAGLFLAGEILDIDALTGGFNFQAAWTCGYLAGLGMDKYLSGSL